ncbi:MAG: acyltransferase family protein [Acutalibacteraceae bacterium]|nr:acyltransferase family protein [Acutalibacteraceae bacterium]
MHNNKMVVSNTSVSNGKRLDWIDIMKALMIFAIVLGHSFTGEDRGDNMLKQYLYSFHVPAFFFVSGFVYKNKAESFGAFAIKKLKGLMIPYYIFAIISILIFMALGSLASGGLGVEVRSTDILPNICGMLYASGSSGYMKWNLPLWFIPCLFVTLLLFYGIVRLVSRAKKGSKAVWVSVFVAFLVLAFLNYYVFNLKKLPFGFEIVVYMFPFFMAGYWLKENDVIAKIQGRLRVVLGIAFIVIGAVLACMADHCVDYVYSIYNNLFMFYIVAFISIMGYVLILQSFSNKLLVYVGRNTLPILLMHKFPIIALQMVLGGIIAKNAILGMCITVVMAIVSCIMSLVAGEIIKRIAPFALGTAKPKTTKEK